MNEKLLRRQLADLLSGGGAHVEWRPAVTGITPKLRGLRPAGFPHSAWELQEHMRIAQWDILEFSRDPKHVSPDWPDGYWPGNPEPPSSKAWEKSLKMFARDLAAWTRRGEHGRSGGFSQRRSEPRRDRPNPDRKLEPS